MKSLAFNVLTTPDKESGLSCLQSVCIEGDIETVNTILNYSPEKLDSAIALSIKIGPNSSDFGGKSISTVLSQKGSIKHKQIRNIVQDITKHFQSKSLLHLAAKKGQVVHLRRLLDFGEHVDSPYLYGETPLMSAARCNEKDPVEFLVERGASLELRDNMGYTPFHHAAMGGKMTNVLHLMELGADIWKESDELYSAIHLAAQNGHTEVVRFLLECGADAKKVTFFESTPLMLAAHNGHLETIELLLKNGGNSDRGDCWGHLPLHVSHHLELVRFFVEQGAVVNARDDGGRTPLHTAADKGQCDTIDYLLNHGAFINARDEYGFSSLFYALRAGHAAPAKFLIDKGCEVNLTNGDSSFLLVSAAEDGLTNVLQLLFDMGFSVDTVGRDRRTPLMAAAEAGQCDAVAFLLDHGANINGIDASCAGIKKRWWLSHGGYHRAKQSIIPLHCALKAGQGEVAKLLIERGADTSDAVSLAELALKSGLFDIPQLITRPDNFNLDKLFEDGETSETDLGSCSWRL